MSGILNIVDEVEAERLRQGLSISDVAEHAQICRATYYHWVEDRACPRLTQLSAVMDVLGMTVTVNRRK